MTRHILIQGPAGNIEAVLQMPDQAATDHIAIVCHPHPLFAGTMNNKVVTTIAKAFNELHIPCLRFNFRGVGNSAGSYGNISGEVADAYAVAQWLLQQWPTAKFCLAGFSFGSYVAAALATKVPTELLISIAPPVERMPFNDLPHIACPWLVIQGEADDVVTPSINYAWFAQLNANKTLLKFPDTGHFFHGKLVELQQVVEDFVKTNIF